MNFVGQSVYFGLITIILIFLLDILCLIKLIVLSSKIKISRSLLVADTHYNYFSNGCTYLVMVFHQIVDCLMPCK